MKILESIKSWWEKPWPAFTPIWIGEPNDEAVLERAKPGEADVLIGTKDIRPWNNTWYCVGTSYEWNTEFGIVVGPIRATETNGILTLSGDVAPEEAAYLKRVYDNAPRVSKTESSISKSWSWNPALNNRNSIKKSTLGSNNSGRYGG